MNIKLLIIMPVLALLLACNQQEAARHGSTSKGSADQYTLSSRFVGKPHAPVAMRYELNSPAELGEPLDITLTFSTEHATPLLEVAYTTGDSFRSLDATQQYQFTQLIKGAKEQVTISVVPLQRGLNHINVFAGINVNGAVQTRAFAIAVNIISEAGVLQKATQNEPANGMRYLPEQNVISMPASEAP